MNGQPAASEEGTGEEEGKRIVLGHKCRSIAITISRIHSTSLNERAHTDTNQFACKWQLVVHCSASWPARSAGDQQQQWRPLKKMRLTIGDGRSSIRQRRHQRRHLHLSISFFLLFSSFTKTSQLNCSLQQQHQQQWRPTECP